MTYHYLWLSEEHARMIAEHGLNGLPHEVCGLIAGGKGRAMYVVPVDNVADDPVNRYVMDQSVLSQKLPEFEDTGLDLIAFYHSHPHGDSIPSPTDIREAYYPGVVHLIIGLKSGKPSLAAWQIDNGRVSSVDLFIGGNPPELEAHKVLTFSFPQKIALIAAAVIVLCLVVFISFYLLPPAPVIPAP